MTSFTASRRNSGEKLLFGRGIHFPSQANQFYLVDLSGKIMAAHVNGRAGMYWVRGPSRWATNEPLSGPGAEHDPWIGGFYRNPQNLDRCTSNLLRAGVALRLVMDLYQAQGQLLDQQPQTDALDRVLEVFDDALDPLARHVLRDRRTE